MPNFREFFHALGCIRLVALLEERTGLGCRDGSDVHRKDRVCYCGASTLPPCALRDSRRASAPPVLDDLGSVRS